MRHTEIQRISEGDRNQLTGTKKPTQVAGFSGPERRVETLRYGYVVQRETVGVYIVRCLQKDYTVRDTGWWRLADFLLWGAVLYY